MAVFLLPVRNLRHRCSQRRRFHVLQKVEIVTIWQHFGRFCCMFTAHSQKQLLRTSRWLMHHDDPANLTIFLRTWTHVRYICCPPSVGHLSATLVHPTQPVEIFGNISTPFGTLAIRWHPRKILQKSSQGNPSVGGVKHNRDSQM